MNNFSKEQEELSEKIFKTFLDGIDARDGMLAEELTGELAVVLYLITLQAFSIMVENSKEGATPGLYAWFCNEVFKYFSTEIKRKISGSNRGNKTEPWPGFNTPQ